MKMFSGFRSRWMMPAACAGESAQELTGNGRDLMRRELTDACDALGQRFAVEVLHHHEAIAIGERAEIEHFENVVAPDLASGLRLALEAKHGLGLGAALASP